MGKEKKVIMGHSSLWGKEEGSGFIKGFSKLNRSQRIKVLSDWLDEDVANDLDLFLHANPEFQSAFSEFSENYLSNYNLPFGVVPNVMVNGQLHLVPMVIEESSVVAAASRAAGFWAKHNGFKAEIPGTQKKGQIHFTWTGSSTFLILQFEHLKKQLMAVTEEITAAMQKRGGGISAIELIDLTEQLENYYQLDVSLETADAMGANFINSCLEKMAEKLTIFFADYTEEGILEVVMSILSNYTPECSVKCTVECAVDELKGVSAQFSPHEFALRFKQAVDMANVSVSRAVTHNKGIFNGVDGVVLATGNDWRAVEAAGHAYASRDGQYRSLSKVEVEGNVFRYSITLPLAIGTVGGLTKSHPLARFSLKMLRNPSATQLMQISAAMGMANNFSAITSLVTSGIQKGHMRMHLSNILNQLGASAEQKEKAFQWFANKTITYSEVEQFLSN